MAEKPEPEKIKIEEEFEVERKDVLTELLIKNREKVLFVGEGDFSFTVAFAALRKAERPTVLRTPRPISDTWNGITATRYEEDSDDDSEGKTSSKPKQEEGKPPTKPKPKPKFSDIIKVCAKECDHRDKKAHIENLTEPPPDSWKYGVDGGHLKEKFPKEKFKVVWFQCPYNGKKDTGYLIRRFLLSASHRVDKGGLVCVGITIYKEYIPYYKLKDLKTYTPIKELYVSSVPYADTKLVKKVLSYGYKHQSYLHNEGVDIHKDIKDYHLTLVFERK